MKKLLSLICALTIALSLAACSKPTPAPAEPGAATPPSEPVATWPSGTVNVYVPATAGGAADLSTRIICTKMSELTGKNFVVINDNSGGGSVAYETLRTAEPDGLTLLCHTVSQLPKMIIGQYEHKLDEFTILNYVNTPGVESAAITVRSNSPFQTIQDLIDYGKAHPNELQAGVQTNGAAHFVHIATNNQFGIKMEYVEGGNNAERIPAFLGGAFDVIIAGTNAVAPYVESGDFRVLAVTGAQRSEMLPDAPCMTELGYEATEVPMYYLFYGPANMPEETVAAFDSYMEQCYADPEVVAQFKALKLDGAYVAHDQCVADIYDCYAQYEAAYESAKK